MDFIPNTREQSQAMLKAVGVSSLEALFRAVPPSVRLAGDLDIPSGLTEPEVLALLESHARANVPLGEVDSFLGAGKYRGFIPAVVDALALRPEFATSYTPYQAEASQGNLQAAFEYQTMICELTGMEVSNASHYDGGTAFAEALGMCIEETGRTRIVFSEGVHPGSRAVARSFFQFRGVELVEVPLRGGVTDLEAMARAVDGRTACVAVQNPNFLGFVEPLARFSEIAAAEGALSVAAVEPVSLGLLKPPGHAGFDIAAGDGQSLGTEPMYGGPAFGFLAARRKLIRRMPGRIVGETTDTEGRRGFVLTLQAREQHIRRERATSNICTNQALMALRAAIYLAALGKRGLPEVANLCLQKAHALADRLRAVGAPPAFSAPFFREFPVRLPKPAAEVIAALLPKKICAGFDLGRIRPDWKHLLLVSVTELTSREAMERFAASLGEVL